jgi:hypothetical protein
MLSVIIATASPAQSKVDLVTLPSRDTVQLTIYNSADLTLVRESRALTLKEGENSLQFSWANTLIDPTSLEMLPKANADKINIADLTYPPRVRNLGLWNIDSDVSGNVPVEITYLTSGLSWRAFYMGTLVENEETMRLQGYVRVTNNSGEDYENAQTRLIVGKVHILDQIAELARRQYPYERPGMPDRYAYDAQARDKRKVPILGDMAVTAGTFIQAVIYTGREARAQRNSKRRPQRILPLYDRRYRNHSHGLVKTTAQLRQK